MRRPRPANHHFYMCAVLELSLSRLTWQGLLSNAALKRCRSRIEKVRATIERAIPALPQGAMGQGSTGVGD